MTHVCVFVEKPLCNFDRDRLCFGFQGTAVQSFTVLDDVLAAKATSTMHAREDALIRYISWARTNGHIPIPFSETVVYAFVNDIGSKSASTFPRSFCCALAFVGHVVGRPSTLECLASRKIIGHAARCYKEKRMLIQKPPIKVQRILILENIFRGEPNLKAHDKVAAGFFLWMVFARARFSDAQAASTIVQDVIGTDMVQTAFWRPKCTVRRWPFPSSARRVTC